MPGSILIVDDSAVMRQVIKRTIEMADLDVERVYEASNGIEAFAQLATHEINVVLLDINMPVMNGVQFLTRMHDDPRLCHVPVVIASTEGSETRIAQLVANGAKGYVRKPFQPEQIRGVLQQYLPVRAAAGNAETNLSDDSF